MDKVICIYPNAVNSIAKVERIAPEFINNDQGPPFSYSVIPLEKEEIKISISY